MKVSVTKPEIVERADGTRQAVYPNPRSDGNIRLTLPPAEPKAETASPAEPQPAAMQLQTIEFPRGDEAVFRVRRACAVVPPVED